jgi:hypothetical protein
LDSIPYDSFVCTAVKFYLCEKKVSSALWSYTFFYFLNTAFSIKEMVEKENFMEKYKSKILLGILTPFQE